VAEACRHIEQVCDVAVVGGGVIGTAAALGLARQGRSVALLEPSRPLLQRGALGMDLRTLALSPGSRSLLDGLGVWAELPLAPYTRMEIWDERGTRTMTFDAAEVGRQELGWILESSPLCVALWEALSRESAATLYPCAMAGLAVRTAAVADAGHVDLDTAQGVLRARLVVAADGAASAVRGHLDVAMQTFETAQAALATVVRTARPHGGVAFQRFLLDGPVALLPAADPHLCSVVWSQRPEQARRRQNLSAAGFCAELEAVVQGCLGSIEGVDRRLVFPLRQQLAASFNPHPRVILLGDAARVVHPLAGLGANLGLEDVRAMLTQLAPLDASADPGADGLWRAFDRRRHARSRLMVGVMTMLSRAYSRGDPLSQWVRNAGVAWLDRTLPVKRQIILEAMGLGAISRSLADGA
jgi:2-polyprenylphenol 6-hydroxylase